MTGQTTTKLTIKYGTISGKRCYRWECTQCGTWGAHRFNRWTDRIRRRPDVHPWRRCLDAVDTHICTYHRGMIRHRTAEKAATAMRSEAA